MTCSKNDTGHFLLIMNQYYFGMVHHVTIILLSLWGNSAVTCNGRELKANVILHNTFAVKMALTLTIMFVNK